MKPRIDLNKEYGIVLEGGGARGAYQIGAWKALREAGVRIKGVAGTSVGALNGALICMDDLETAEKIWKNMTYSRVLSVDDKFMESLHRLDVRGAGIPEIAAGVRRVLADRGLDITPLKDLIAGTVDEEKIRMSPRELYATTFSLSDRREITFDLRTAPEGTMKDLLLASAYFPGFKNEKLGGKTYMDGGSVNNVPVNVLTDRGYEDIIVIRIYGIGVDTEKYFQVPEGVRLYRIAPRRNLGGILEFGGKRIRRNLLLGYYDGLRMVYGLAGRKYYFDMPYSEAYYFDKLLSELELLKLYLEPFVKKEEMERLSGYRAYTEGIFPTLAKKFRLPADWDYRDLYGAIIEVCAKKMGLEVFCIYTADDVIGRIYRILGESRKLGENPNGFKWEKKEGSRGVGGD